VRVNVWVACVEPWFAEFNIVVDVQASYREVEQLPIRAVYTELRLLKGLRSVIRLPITELDLPPACL
jgi:hypothetical protein